jgi:hypothetical protein
LNQRKIQHEAPSSSAKDEQERSACHSQSTQVSLAN